MPTLVTLETAPLHEEHRLIRTKPEELDVYRTWTLIAYLLDHNKVQSIFSDKALINALHAHAESLGHTEAELNRWFGSKVGEKYSGSKLRHWDGHSTHFHLRVRSDHTHRSWQDMAQTLDPQTLAKLRTKTRSASKDTHEHQEALHDHPEQAATVAQLSQPPAIQRRFSGSRSTQHARNRARGARLRARLLAAQSRAQQRHRLGLTSAAEPPLVEQTAPITDDTDLEALKPPQSGG